MEWKLFWSRIWFLKKPQRFHKKSKVVKLLMPVQRKFIVVLAFSYNIWPHCAPSGTQEDDHEHNWRWQDEAAPGPDSPPEVSNYSNFLWYDNFFMCRQTCIITDVGSFLALSNISSTLVDFWMSGWKLAKLKTDHGDTGKLSGQIKFVFTFLLAHQQKIHNKIWVISIQLNQT